MRNLLTELKDICLQYPLDEKVVVVPSHSLGYQLMQALTESGCPSLNLKVEILSEVACRFCSFDLHRKNLSLVSAVLADYLLQGILEKLSGEKKLQYFGELEITPGIAAAFHRSINELRLAGLEASDLDEKDFLRPEKGADIKKVMDLYCDVLEENGLIDEAGLYRMAVEKVKNDKALFIIPANFRLQPLERQFLESIPKERRLTVHFTPIQGLERPPFYYSPRFPRDKKVEGLSPLALLYDPENATFPSGGLSVDMFRAYGESNEVREVVRRIKRDSISFDHAAVFYSAREPYAQLFYDLSKVLELPVTFGQGVAVTNAAPGRLFFAVMDWMRSGYEVSRLYPVLTGGDMKVEKDDGFSGFTLARILRKSKVGWGRERYLEVLEREIKEYRQKFLKAEEKEEAERYHQYAELLSRALEVVKDIFAVLPEPDEAGRVDLGALAGGVAEFIKRFSRITCRLDEEAEKAILDQLNLFERFTGEKLAVADALDRLEEAVGALRVGSSTPRPGYLHVDHYRRGIWTFRPHTYLIGLDAGRFPGDTREDAVVLDAERRKINGELSLSRDGTKESTYEMAQLLASLPGRVTLSYSAFDTAENRDLFPSAVLLQVYRLVNGDESKDYSQLVDYLGGRKGFVPEEEDKILADSEWWLFGFLKKAWKNHLNAVTGCYENLGRGIAAFNKRMSAELTKYDGRVSVEEGIMDPRKNHELVLSASQLETLAACPFRFFIRYVLTVYPPEDVVYEPERWLDLGTRGKLLHRIFEEFYKKVAEKDERPSRQKHEKFLMELAEELVKRQKEELPPPGPVAYENERAEILESCRIFLAGEEEEEEGVKPQFFEISFGVGKGGLPPVKVELPSGEKFYLQGRVDRVDCTGPSSYRVIDYKTGRAVKFGPHEYFKGGRQLQHALYALALEKLLEEAGLAPGARVTAGGYYFPTTKGEGEKVIREQNRREELFVMLEKLFEIMKQGAFVMTDEKKECTYCDYKKVCEADFLRDYLAEKLENSEARLLKELRNYE